ncbi:MAG: DUF2007 domain-containing protein [Pirellulales bacterium]
MSRYVCVFVAETLPEAHLVRNRLADYGIEARIQNEGAAGEGGQDWNAAPRVCVPEEDSEFAREVAEDFAERRQTREQRGGRPDWPTEPLDWHDWPTCPRCRRRRLTRCPACHTTGTQFPLAEFVSSDSADAPLRFIADSPDSPGDDVLVVCSTCDEPFTPEFYRRCESCGHEFRQGLDTPEETVVEATARRGVRFLLSWALALATLYLAWRLLR